jgi:hypothetical protein
MTMLERFQKVLAAFADDRALGAFVEDGRAGMHAWSKRRVSASTRLTVRLRADVRLSEGGCPEGAKLSLEGSIGLERLQARLLLRRAWSDETELPHNEEFDVALVPKLERIEVPRVVGAAPVGAGRSLRVRFVDGRGQALSHEMYVGRGSREAMTVQAHLGVPAEVIVWLTATDCAHARGPILDMAGELRFPAGIVGSFQLRDDRNPPGDALGSGTVDLAVLPAGVDVPFRPQRVMAATGGSPWLSVRFMDVSGRLFGDEVAVGRCVQLPCASA